MLVSDDLSQWRWVIISSVLALQGASVCTLSGFDTSGRLMLTEASQKAVTNWLDAKSRTPYPSERLATPKELVRRISDPETLPSPFTVPVSRDELADVDLLVDLRNEFIHFTPKVWSLELSGLPRLNHSAWVIVSRMIRPESTFSHRMEKAEAAELQAVASELCQFFSGLID
jgi:hypothetical protein